jgi:ubiquitin C-terminal hydrolase
MLDVRHVNSLAEALDQLVAPEKLCDDNRWHCAGCESLVCSFFCQKPARD